MNHTIDNYRKFRLLTRFEQSIVLESWLGLAAARLGLRLAGFQRCKNMMARLTPKRMPGTGASPSARTTRTIAKMEEAAARHFPFHVNCLERSLVLMWLLRKQGIAADLRIGARKESNCFEAHAWVEFESAVLNDAAETHLHFVPFQAPINSMETQTP